MTNDFLMQLLASWFDKFKASNPKTAALILTALGAVVALAPTVLPLIGVNNPSVITIVQAIAVILGFLTGSRTTQILTSNEEKKTI